MTTVKTTLAGVAGKVKAFASAKRKVFCSHLIVEQHHTSSHIDFVFAACSFLPTHQVFLMYYPVLYTVYRKFWQRKSLANLAQIPGGSPNFTIQILTSLDINKESKQTGIHQMFYSPQISDGKFAKVFSAKTPRYMVLLVLQNVHYSITCTCLARKKLFIPGNTYIYVHVQGCNF